MGCGWYLLGFLHGFGVSGALKYSSEWGFTGWWIFRLKNGKEQ